jgi:phosphoglycerate dehydrogenase-like enzyme
MPLKILVYVTIPEQATVYRNAIASAQPDIELKTVLSVDEVAADIEDTDILMSFGAALRRRPDVLAKGRRLKWVSALGTGLDGIIDAPTLSKDVIVTATRGIHGVPMSEMAFMLMLSLARNMPRVVHQQDQAVYKRWPPSLLHGKTIGILGVGLIAEALAPRCAAFGMDVVGISRTKRPLPGFHRFHPRSALRDIVGTFDYFVLLIPLDEETRGMVDAGIIAAMKPTGYLINLARGEIVDEDALMAALRQNRIAGAALDTFHQEPLPPDSPWWRMPNVIVTPHIAGTYDRYAADAAQQFLGNLTHFLAGRPELMQNRER